MLHVDFVDDKNLSGWTALRATTNASAATMLTAGR
jgi:hypothetical protein